MPEADDDLFAALRRLRAAFGPIEIVQVASNEPGDDLAAAQGEPVDEGGKEHAGPQADDP